MLGGTAVADLGYGFALWPVAANTLVLLTIAYLFNNVVSHSYPHVLTKPATGRGIGDPATLTGIAITSTDVTEALRELNTRLDVHVGDLEAVLQRAQTRSCARRARASTRPSSFCAGTTSRSCR